MRSRLLLVLPAVAVGIVLWAVLSTGWPAPVSIARVVGGPTLGARVLAWQLSVQRLHEGRREPRPGLGLRLLVDTGSERATWTGTSDGNGRVEARVHLVQPLRQPVQVRVESGEGQLLAQGQVQLAQKQWLNGARRLGGPLPGQQKGELWVHVWPREGTLAVPFVSEVLIRVTHGPRTAGMPDAEGYAGAPGVELDVELTGAERSDPSGPLRTDERGQARLRLRPQEHAILLRVRARLPATAPTPSGQDFLPLRFTPGLEGDPRSGEWFGALPVTPGALHAALDGAQLLVRSPIPRDEAYVSLIDGQHRTAGYTVALQPDAEGGASGRVPLEAQLLQPATGELYAVVSSEPDKRSSSAVGWHIGPLPLPDVTSTLDVSDRLLLDGSEGALQRERELRLGRRRVAATLLALVGALMVAAFAREARSSARRAAAAPAELGLGSQRGWLALAFGCLLLGLGALAYFGLLQR